MDELWQDDVLGVCDVCGWQPFRYCRRAGLR